MTLQEPLLPHQDDHKDETPQEVSSCSQEPPPRSSFRSLFFDRKGACLRLMVLVAFLALGFSATVGVVPAVMTDRYARLKHGYSDPTPCSDYHVMPEACLEGSSDAQNAAAAQSLVQNSFTFVTGSLMGSISDKRGRRGVMCVGAFLNALAPIALVFIQLFPTLNPFWYYAAGASAGLVSCFAMLLTSLADVMPPEWRAASFGTLFAGIYFGFAMGPQIALVLPSHLAVSVFAASMMVLCFLTAVFLVPETRRTNDNINGNNTAITNTEGGEAQVFDAQEKLADMWKILMRPLRELSILNRNSLFRLLAVLAFFSGMVTSGDQTLLVYYAEERLAFDDHDVATLFLITGLLSIVVQSLLIKPFIDSVGERRVLVFSFAVGAFYNTLYGFATTKKMLLMAAAVGTISAMSFPTISAIKANNVSSSEQGRIQGALFSVQALSQGTGPVLMRFVYHLTKDKAYPGAGSMFVFAGGLLLVATGCSYALPEEQANSSHRHAGSDEEVSITLHSSSGTEEDSSTPFLLEDPLGGGDGVHHEGEELL